jgi:hypothetical protein
LRDRKNRAFYAAGAVLRCFDLPTRRPSGYIKYPYKPLR